ncbi:MAG: hypothetical protein PHX21_13610 [bacterium]|nr:hypothetical protein [bacterium]
MSKKKEKNKPMLDVMLECVVDGFFDKKDREKIKKAIWIKEVEDQGYKKEKK